LKGEEGSDGGGGEGLLLFDECTGIKNSITVYHKAIRHDLNNLVMFLLSRGSECTRLGNEVMSLRLTQIDSLLLLKHTQALHHDVTPYLALMMSCCKRSSVASSPTPEVRAPS